MKEAAVGTAAGEPASSKSVAGQGLSPEAIAAFLRRNADLLEAAKLPRGGGVSVQAVATDSVGTLSQVGTGSRQREGIVQTGGFGAAPTRCWRKSFSPHCSRPQPDEEIVAVRAQADRELSGYPAQDGGRPDRATPKTVRPEAASGKIRPAAAQLCLLCDGIAP